jgi:hypothetical protein
MTPRAVILGFLCGAFLCAVCFFNDEVIRQSVMIRCFLPVSVYGALVLFVIAVNPLLRRVWSRLALTGREVAVVTALSLAVCYVPGYALIQPLTSFLILPKHYERVTPGWRSAGVIDRLPSYMLVDTSTDESTVLDGYVQGLGTGSESFGLSDIPWHGWTATLGFWLPLVFTLSVASIALAVVVHRQWSEHEHIPYPIAAFAHALLPDKERRWGAVMRGRLFWIGLAIPLVIHLNNYTCGWHPNHMVRVRLLYDFTALHPLLPALARGGGWMLLRPRLIFTVVGFAFFLATDVSLSLGLAPFVYCTVVGILAGMGVSLTGAQMSQGYVGYLHAGAFLAMFGLLLYRGRHFYWNVARRTVFLRSADDVQSCEAWGGRVFVAASVLLIWQVTRTGLDWQLAFLYVCVGIALLLVLSRVVAETGVFYIYPTFFPCALVGGFFGFQALGVQPMLLMLVITSVLFVNPSEALMPFMVHAIKLVELNRIPRGRLAVLGAGALAVGIAVALPATLYWQYGRGGKSTGHGWITNSVPRFAFNEAVRIQYKLDAQGTLAAAEARSGWERLAHISPDGGRMLAFGITFGLVLLFAAARTRSPRFPFHPVMFLVLGTWQSRILASSFLVGWAVKHAVTRYGGHATYQRLRPLMIGFIAGEMLAGVLLLLFGALYYFATGQPPVPYRVLPI